MPVQVLFPTNSGSFYTASAKQVVSGTASPLGSTPSIPEGTSGVDYVGYLLTAYTGAEPPLVADPSDGSGLLKAGLVFYPSDTSATWSLSIPDALSATMIAGTTYRFQFYTVYKNGNLSAPTVSKVSYKERADIRLFSPRPSGISLKESFDEIKIEVPAFRDDATQGNVLAFDFYVSQEPDGVYTLVESIDASTPTINTYEIESTSQVEQEVVSNGVKTNLINSAKVYTEVPTYVFTMNFNKYQRLVSSGKFISVSDFTKAPLYFKVATQSYDSVRSEAATSLLSAEYEGRFLKLLPDFTALPERNSRDIRVDYISTALALEPTLNLSSGSVFRDILDPLFDEFSRLYARQDISFQAMSWEGLLLLDDENGDGVSDAVTDSVFKTTFKDVFAIATDKGVQDTIDALFEQKASDLGIERLGSSYAGGSVSLFLANFPSAGLFVDKGSLVSSVQGVNYQVSAAKAIPFESRNLYYDADIRQYVIELPIKSIVPGQAGNAAPGVIKYLGAGFPSGSTVTNKTPIVGGEDRESNKKLAQRAKYAFTGLNAGTEGSYIKHALMVRDVESVRVEQAGDPLMQRDLLADGKHSGGCIDVYIRGNLPVTVSEKFSFDVGTPSASMQEGERFAVRSASSFQLRSTNPRVGIDNPITDVLKVYNATKGAHYDLANWQTTGDQNVIILQSSVVNKAIGLKASDVVYVDYRYQGESSYVLKNQPAYEIVSVFTEVANDQGDVTGSVALSPKAYSFIRNEDPLQLGFSNKASSGIDLIESELPEAINGKRFLNREFKTVALINTPINLEFLGVEPSSVVVMDETKTVTYRAGVDYSLDLGTGSIPTAVTIKNQSAIRAGSIINIAYKSERNYTVTYNYNSLMDKVDSQYTYNKIKGAGDNVVVKEAVKNDVDISLNILSQKGVPVDVVRQQVIAAVSAFIASKNTGAVYGLDDLIHKVKAVPGVIKVALPVQVFQKKDGSFIPWDNLGSVPWKIYSENNSTNRPTYITVDPVLSFPTILSGGKDDSEFRAVYESGKVLKRAKTITEVGNIPGSFYITSEGRLIVSTTDGVSPVYKNYAAAYYTYQGAVARAEDIITSPTEYLSVGASSINLTIEQV